MVCYIMIYICPAGHHHQVSAVPAADCPGAWLCLRLPGGPRLSRPLRSGPPGDLPVQLHH